MKLFRGDDGRIEVEDVVVIEALEPFFTMLKNKDREFWFREELVCRDRIDMKRITQGNFMQLVFAEPNTSNRRLRSVHNYDILSNPTYSDRFLYIPCTYPQRSDYMISKFKDPYMRSYSSDLVRMVCDLAYLPKSVGQKLVFSEIDLFKHMVQLKRTNKADSDLNP